MNWTHIMNCLTAVTYYGNTYNVLHNNSFLTIIIKIADGYTHISLLNFADSKSSQLSLASARGFWSMRRRLSVIDLEYSCAVRGRRQGPEWTHLRTWTVTHHQGLLRTAWRLHRFRWCFVVLKKICIFV